MTDALEGRRLGFLGGGAMATALIGGLRAAGVSAERIAVGEPDPERRKRLADAHGVVVHAANEDALRDADTAVIAVKPAVVAPALAELRAAAGDAGLTRPLWVSIAAGVSLATVEAALPEGARVVRVMPNTPAQVGAGASAYCANPHATAADRAVVCALFEAVGRVWEVPAESHLDAVTGLSGSGPAFVFVFLEALADAGVRAGLPRDIALELAAQTVRGAAHLVLETTTHPAVLKDRVTSPGGTTIAGLERLEAGGLRAAVYEAVEAAARRSRELGRS